MNLHLSMRRTVALTMLAIVAAAAVLVWSLGSPRPADATDSALAPITAVSSAQADAIPALRAPATLAVPDSVRRATQDSFVAAKFAPNPALARAVEVPGSSTPWAVVPGNGTVCLTSGDNNGLTCASLADAAAGKLYIQLIQPPDADHALPQPGQPVQSTIVGVAPAGVTDVSANTTDGTRVAGHVLPGGLYTVSGTNLSGAALSGGKATVSVALAVQ